MDATQKNDCRRPASSISFTSNAVNQARSVIGRIQGNWRRKPKKSRNLPRWYEKEENAKHLVSPSLRLFWRSSILLLSLEVIGKKISETDAWEDLEEMGLATSNLSLRIVIDWEKWIRKAEGKFTGRDKKRQRWGKKCMLDFGFLKWERVSWLDKFRADILIWYHYECSDCKRNTRPIIRVILPSVEMGIITLVSLMGSQIINAEGMLNFFNGWPIIEQLNSYLLFEKMDLKKQS